MKASALLLLLSQLALSYQAKEGEEAIRFWDNFWEFIYPWIVPEPFYEKKISEELGPDICYRCLSHFGLTISGRVRDGCPKCQGTWNLIQRSTTQRFYEHLKDKLGESQVELEMARALLLFKKSSEVELAVTQERKRSLIKW